MRGQLVEPRMLPQRTVLRAPDRIEYAHVPALPVPEHQVDRVIVRAEQIQPDETPETRDRTFARKHVMHQCDGFCALTGIKYRVDNKIQLKTTAKKT